MTTVRFTCRLVPALLQSVLLAACGTEQDTGEVADELGLQGNEGRHEIVVLDEKAKTKVEETEIAKPDSVLLILYQPDGEFTVQIGLYEDAQTAGKIVRDLSAAGYPAYAIAKPDKKGVRVRIGYFATRAEAERFGRRFREDRGLEYWIDRRSRELF